MSVTNHGTARAARADQLRRGRARPGRRRPRAPGVQQPVRRDHRRARARRADRARGGRAPAPSACISVHVLSGRGRVGGADASTRPTARGSSAAAARSSGRRRSSGSGPLSNTTGAVLDPIVSLRQTVRVPPGGTARLTFTTGFADNEDGARAADREVPRSPRRRARARAGQHAQPDRAAPPRPDRRRDHALPAARRTAALRRSAPARRRSRRPATAAASAICGSTASPATCRSCWCASHDDAEHAARCASC